MGLQPVNNVECQKLPADFMQLLASCVRKDAFGNSFINFIYSTVDACDCDAYIDCTNNHLTPDQVLRTAFTTDGCGNLALRMGNCDGTVAGGELV